MEQQEQDSLENDLSPRKQKSKESIRLKEVIPSVCGVVLHLREVQGCTADQVMSYLKAQTTYDESQRPVVIKALKKAVKSNFLKETSDGKYRLVFDDSDTIERLLTKHCTNCCFATRRRQATNCNNNGPLSAGCGRRRRRKSRRRRGCRRRRCTRPWVPRRCKNRAKRFRKKKGHCKRCPNLLSFKSSLLAASVNNAANDTLLRDKDPNERPDDSNSENNSIARASTELFSENELSNISRKY